MLRRNRAGEYYGVGGSQTQMATSMVLSSELAKARAMLYQLLAAAYIRSPDLELLKLLVGWVVSQTEAKYQFDSEQISYGLATLDRFFKRIDQNSWEESEKEISIEFTRLFRGVKKEYSPPPPYESVCCEESGCVFSKRTMEVYRQFRSFGYNLTD